MTSALQQASAFEAVGNSELARNAKVLFLTGGSEVPSFRFRVEPYLAGLRRFGWKCSVRHCRPEMNSEPPSFLGSGRIAWRTWTCAQHASRILHGVTAGRYDVVVIQQKLSPWPSAAGERWVARRAPRFVLDIDDALHEASLEARAKMEEIARLADLVLCGNEELLKFYAPHAACAEYLPTPIDTERYRPRRPESVRPGQLVWVGSSSNYPQLEVLTSAFEKLLAKDAGLKPSLRIVADVPPPFGTNLSGVPVEFRNWSPNEEIASLEEASVGLMPLEDTPWNRGKCGLKLLLYMARGVPALASPVGANARIIQHGENGLLATTPEEWANQIHSLIHSPETGLRFGKKGRATAETEYSVSRWLPELHRLLLQMIRNKSEN